MFLLQKVSIFFSKLGLFVNWEGGEGVSMHRKTMAAAAIIATAAAYKNSDSNI
jgi:hypothetical protein